MADFVCPGILSPSLAVFNRVYGAPITAASDRDATAEQKRIGEERQRCVPTNQHHDNLHQKAHQANLYKLNTYMTRC